MSKQCNSKSPFDRIKSPRTIIVHMQHDSKHLHGVGTRGTPFDVFSAACGADA
jgi:hypothetical protein